MTARRRIADPDRWKRPRRNCKPLDADRALALLRKGNKISGIVSALSVGESRAKDIRQIGEDAGLLYDVATARMYAPGQPRPVARPAAPVTARHREVVFLAPRHDDPDWRQRGLCRREDPDLFFSEDPAGIAQAKAACAACPARAACLSHALETRQEFGVWGGLDAAERRQISGSRPKQGELRKAAGFCPAGRHRRTDANITVRADGHGDRCRDCDADRARDRYQREKEAMAS